MRGIYHDLVSTISLRFQSYSGTATGQVVVDLQGFSGALIQIISGTITSGTFGFGLSESNDGTNFTAVNGSDILGTLPSFAATDDDTIKEFGYIGSKRYIRVDITSAINTPVGVFGGVVIRGEARHRPVR